MMNEMTPEQKAKIDSMDYEAMLRAWRYTPVGDRIFTGKAGIYFTLEMTRKARELSHDECVRISKKIDNEK